MQFHMIKNGIFNSMNIRDFFFSLSFCILSSSLFRLSLSLGRDSQLMLKRSRPHLAASCSKESSKKASSTLEAGDVLLIVVVSLPLVLASLRLGTGVRVPLVNEEAPFLFDRLR